MASSTQCRPHSPRQCELVASAKDQLRYFWTILIFAYGLLVETFSQLSPYLRVITNPYEEDHKISRNNRLQVMLSYSCPMLRLIPFQANLHSENCVDLR